MGLTLEALRDVAPNARLLKADGTETAPASPGRTLQHYAPRTRLVIRSEPTLQDSERSLKIGLLSSKVPQEPEFTHIEQLSNDLPRAAAAFFAALRRLDAADLDLIIATPFPDHGLGVALNDRLMAGSSLTIVALMGLSQDSLVCVRATSWHFKLQSGCTIVRRP